MNEGGGQSPGSVPYRLKVELNALRFDCRVSSRPANQPHCRWDFTRVRNPDTEMHRFLNQVRPLIMECGQQCLDDAGHPWHTRSFQMQFALLFAVGIGVYCMIGYSVGIFPSVIALVTGIVFLVIYLICCLALAFVLFPLRDQMVESWGNDSSERLSAWLNDYRQSEEGSRYIIELERFEEHSNYHESDLWPQWCIYLTMITLVLFLVVIPVVVYFFHFQRAGPQHRTAFTFTVELKNGANAASSSGMTADDGMFVAVAVGALGRRNEKRDKDKGRKVMSHVPKFYDEGPTHTAEYERGNNNDNNDGDHEGEGDGAEGTMEGFVEGTVEGH